MPNGDASATPWPHDPPSEVTPRQGETLAEALYAALRRDIIAGVRPAGERLRIERIGALYGIGPTPLREALQRLCADGLVLASGHRGFAVAPLDIGEFEDLNRARISVEKEALRLSLPRGDDDWEADVVAASYRLGKADAALEARGAQIGAQAIDAWEEANTRFHTALVTACGSRWLLRVRQTLHDQCERYRRVSVDPRRGSRDLASEHAEIARAALAREVETTCELTEMHFERTARGLAERMRGEEGSE